MSAQPTWDVGVIHNSASGILVAHVKWSSKSGSSRRQAVSPSQAERLFCFLFREDSRVVSSKMYRSGRDEDIHVFDEGS